MPGVCLLLPVVDGGGLEEYCESGMTRPEAVVIQVMSDKIELAVPGAAVVNAGVCRRPEHGRRPRGEREAQEFRLLISPAVWMGE